MPFHRSSLLALVGILLTGATGVAIWMARRPAEGRALAVHDADSPSYPISESLRRPKPRHPGWVDTEWDNDVMDPAETDVAPPSLSLNAHPAEAENWSHYQPTPEELAYRAFKVEEEANQELSNLLQVLDLNEAQQDRVFAALARRSPFYHPSLQPVGQDGAPVNSPSTTPALPAAPGISPADPAPTADESAPLSPLPADPVVAELTPEQVDVYERYTSERDAFWVGVVEDVEQEINAQ